MLTSSLLMMALGRNLVTNSACSYVSPTSLILVTYYGDFISRVRVRVRFRYKVIFIMFVILYVKKRTKLLTILVAISRL